MYEYINKLVSISSVPFNNGEPALDPMSINLAGSLAEELAILLSEKDGFYAFELALRVFSSRNSECSIGIKEWNCKSLWAANYKHLVDDCLFFAEDVFGGQFCIKDNAIYSFDPETGDLEQMATSIDEWAKIILEDYDYWTGYSLAHEWQEINGPLGHEIRLIPKIPFVCGGEFEIENLTNINSITSMKSRANLAMQILNSPDGSEISFHIE